MRRAPVVAYSALLLACACRDSAAPVLPAALIIPDSVVVFESDSILLHAQVTDSSGHQVTGQTVLWFSGDTSIASVSAAGVVHFTGVGRTFVAALAGGLSGRTVVTAVLQIQQMDLGSVYAQASPTACAVTVKGSVYCLDTEHGDSLRLLATNVGPVKQVAVGTDQACLLTIAGAAYCWGAVTTPVPVMGGHSFESLTTGVSHVCGLTAAGEAFCWGLNSAGQLGNGDTTVTSSSAPVPVSGALTFRSIAAGDFQTCGVTTGGAAYCWGSNTALALGSADSTIGRSFTPVAVAVDSPLTAVSAGALYGCARTTAGAAWCWGNWQWGQVGVDTADLNTCPTLPSGYVCNHSPHAVQGGLQFQQLSAHAGLGNTLNGLTCGLTVSGSAYCWGRNVYGEVGDGSTIQRDTPVPVAGGLKFSRIVTGDFHACGFAVSGTVYCWGYTLGPVPMRIPDQP